jgi:ribosome maturation factor RimP
VPAQTLRGDPTAPAESPFALHAPCEMRCYVCTRAFASGENPTAVPEVGARPLFFMSFQSEETVSALQNEIEARLAQSDPDVEVLLVEVVSRDTLRLFIDHPGGVTLEVCERVTRRLSEYREQYSLEVSSPGQDRPLTKPQHYSRFLGRRARVRLREERDGPAPDARRPVSVTGELVGASDKEVTIAATDGVVSIPYEQIARSNLVPGD